MTTTSSLEDLMADQTQLIPVPPMPDEDIAGYAGRVVNVHGAYTLKDLYSPTSNVVAAHSWKIYLPLLSRTSLLDPMSLVALHTSYYLNTLLSSTENTKPSPDDRLHSIRSDQLSAPLRRLRFCKDCAHEDLSYWGYSYWRRSHQIPGVDWCPKHSRLLTISDRRPTLECTTHPDQIPGKYCEEQTELSNHPRKLATRYSHIVFGLLEARGQFTYHQLVECLNTRALEARVQCTVKKEMCRSMVSAIKIKSSLELDWIKTLLLGEGTKDMKKLDRIFRLTFRRERLVPMEAYALALAILFSRSDHALSTLLQTSTASDTSATSIPDHQSMAVHSRQFRSKSCAV